MFSRRDFLKTTGLVGAAAPLMGANYSLLEESKKVTSATHWGTYDVTIKNGQIEEVSPMFWEAHKSPLQSALKSRTYNQTRVEYPYVREGFLKNRHKSDTTKRGAEKFIRVSWEEVNQILFEELTRVQKTHGQDSVYAGSYGWYGAGKVNNPQILLKRMLNVTGNQFVDSIGTYSTGAINVINPYVIGINHHHKHTALETIAKNTDTLILLGNDFYTTCQVDWGSTDHRGYKHWENIKKLGQKRGMKFISIDPQVTDSAKYLGAETIQIVPNTDVALMMGIAHYIYTNKMHNEKFLKKYTVGFDDFKDYLLGKTKEKVEKTPAWASKVTGIPEKKIIELAKLLVETRSMLMPGWSLQRGDHGEQANWMTITLAAMVGQIGKPGGGFGSSYQYSAAGSSRYNGAGIAGISAGKPLSAGSNSAYTVFSNKAIPVARISEMLLNPGKVIDFNGKKVEYADIKMIWWAGGNPMHHHQDRNTMVKAWQKPEVIVNQDPFWTASSRMADIVLPATTEIERNDIVNVASKSTAGLVAIKQGIEPVGESRNDYDIMRGIAAKYGREKEFTEGNDQMAWIKKFYNDSKAQGEAKGIKMPSFKEFWDKGYVEFENKLDGADDYNAFEDFIDDPLDSPLGTPSGKIEIFSKKIDSFGYDDCYGHAAWFEPVEYLGNKTKEAPLHLVSPHPKFRLHSQMNNTVLREIYEVQGREPIYIHPKNAKVKGIKSGDVVLVSNARGKVLAGAMVTEDIREDVVMLPEGSWYDPVEPGKVGSMCAHGDVNLLTYDKGTSKLAQGNIAHTALVNIEKYTGKLPPVKVFSKPNLG